MLVEMNLLKISLSAVLFSLLSKNIQTLTPEKFLISQKGQTIKPLSVKKKQHCPYTTKVRLLSLFHRQDKYTEEIFFEGLRLHLYCHCLGWEEREMKIPHRQVPHQLQRRLWIQKEMQEDLEKKSTWLCLYWQTDADVVILPSLLLKK